MLSYSPNGSKLFIRILGSEWGCNLQTRSSRGIPPPKTLWIYITGSLERISQDSGGNSPLNAIDARVIDPITLMPRWICKNGVALHRPIQSSYEVLCSLKFHSLQAIKPQGFELIMTMSSPGQEACTVIALGALGMCGIPSSLFTLAVFFCCFCDS